MTDRQDGKSGVVLDAAQPLFVDRKFDVVFIEYRDGAVVVIAGDPHHQHVSARDPRQSILTAGAATGAPASMVRAGNRSNAGDIAAATPQHLLCERVGDDRVVQSRWDIEAAKLAQITC